MAHPYMFRTLPRFQNLGSVEEDEPARIVIDGSDYQPFEEYIPSYDPYLPPMDALPVPVDNYQGFILDAQTGQAAVFETSGASGGYGGGGGGFSVGPAFQFSPTSSAGVSVPGMNLQPEITGGSSYTPPDYFNSDAFIGPRRPGSGVSITLPERATIGPREVAPVLPVVLMPGVVPGVTTGPGAAFVDEVGPALAPPGAKPSEGGFPWGLLVLGALAFLS